MKVICERAALVESLNLVGAVVVTRTPKPVLACVKLSAADGQLTLSATDLEVSLRLTTAKVEISEPGEALLPADKFGQIVRESQDATLTIESDGGTTQIRGQDARYKVLGPLPQEFPTLPGALSEADFTIPAGDLTRLVQRTIYATAKENSRYAINGVLMERENNKLAVVATDGHRLALAKGHCQSTRGDNRSAIVPTKALTMLGRLLGDGEQPVQVKVADNQILFATESALLTSNLVEGNFPPYKDVIPRDGDRKASLNADALANAFRRAKLLTTEESKGVRMSFTKEGLTLTSRAPEMGEAEIKVALPAYEGEPVEIGFNPDYMLDVLKVTAGQEVTLDMRATNKPGVLRTASDFLYVIMPVNLQ